MTCFALYSCVTLCDVGRIGWSQAILAIAALISAFLLVSHPSCTKSPVRLPSSLTPSLTFILRLLQHVPSHSLSVPPSYLPTQRPSGSISACGLFKLSSQTSQSLPYVTHPPPIDPVTAHYHHSNEIGTTILFISLSQYLAPQSATLSLTFLRCTPCPSVSSNGPAT